MNLPLAIAGLVAILALCRIAGRWLDRLPRRHLARTMRDFDVRARRARGDDPRLRSLCESVLNFEEPHAAVDSTGVQ